MIPLQYEIKNKTTRSSISDFDFVSIVQYITTLVLTERDRRQEDYPGVHAVDVRQREQRQQQLP